MGNGILCILTNSSLARVSEHVQTEDSVPFPFPAVNTVHVVIPPNPPPPNLLLLLDADKLEQTKGGFLAVWDLKLHAQPFCLPWQLCHSA